MERISLPPPLTRILERALLESQDLQISGVAVDSPRRPEAAIWLPRRLRRQGPRGVRGLADALPVAMPSRGTGQRNRNPH